MSGFVNNGSSGGSFTAGGDLSGTSSSQTVVGIDNVLINFSTLTANNLLSYNGTNWINSLITNSNVSSSASITYSKLNLTGNIINTDISATAAIAGTKISPAFGSQNVSNTGSLTQSGGSFSLSGNANSTIATTSTATLGITTGSGALSLGVGSTGALTIGAVGNNATTILGKGIAVRSATNTSISFGAGSGASDQIAFGFYNTAGTSFTGIMTLTNSTSPVVIFSGTKAEFGGEISGDYGVYLNNSFGDNTSYGVLITAGASASGGSSGAVMLDIQNTDGTDMLQIIQDATLTGVNVVPTVDNTCSLGTASLGFANVCTHGFDWLGSIQTTAGSGGSATIPTHATGYFKMQVNGTTVCVPYFPTS